MEWISWLLSDGQWVLWLVVPNVAYGAMLLLTGLYYLFKSWKG